MKSRMGDYKVNQTDDHFSKLKDEFELALENITPGSLLNFEVELVGHCNLNCKWCVHYCPLVKEEFLDVDSFKKDCDRLSELFDGEIDLLDLMGGEPLLHPQITEFIRIAREAFPIGKICIVTNGILLPSMPEDFWEACKKYDVIIAPTHYPIKIDYDELEKTIESRGINYFPLNSAHNIQVKHLIRATEEKAHLNSLSKYNFLHCERVSCVTLKHGKMYLCSPAAHALRLKEYFNLDIHLSEKNGIDIYSVQSGDELLEKLARPIPFCAHCEVTREKIFGDWGLSRKDRYEWLDFEFKEEDMQYLKSKKPVVYVFGAGDWGHQAVALLQNEGIAVKSVLVTRKKQSNDNVLGVPIVILDELGEVEPNSICLVALAWPTHKTEVYPLLSQVGFGDVVQIFGLD